ncbi:MAG: sulfatase [Burkholderiaceae bacterium]
MNGPSSRRGMLSAVGLGAVAAAAVAALGTEAYLLLHKRPMTDLYGPYPPREKLGSLKRVNPDADRPNVVVVCCDDLGYADVGCFGSTLIRTPNIDRLAREGLRATDFYVCNAVCSPSRAGLLTGRYPFRSGMTGNPYPADEARGQTMARAFAVQLSALAGADLHEHYAIDGLSDRELTLAAALKVAGYRTAMIGKWHLGDFSRQPEFNPRRFGFDRYFGVPHSNDMRPCPLYRDERQEHADIIDILPEITRRYTEEAVNVIEQAGGEPFFLYLAHTFPHQPLAASARFAGKSQAGPHGDAVEEIDWSVGEIVAALERSGVAENTLVVFTSDNGPWFEGSAGELKGGKGQTTDGGFKVPFIARWPRRIRPATRTSELITNLDLFPTLLDLAGVSQPADRAIDGVNIRGVLDGSATRSPRESFYYYHYDELQAVRSGPWKYVRHTNRYVWPIPLDDEALPRKLAGKQLGPDRAPLLYHLGRDAGERYNVIAHHPDVAARLEAQMAAWETQAKANPRGFAAPAS